MKNTGSLSLKLAGAASLALLLASSAFADYRHPDQTSRRDDRDNRDNRDNGSYRNNGSSRDNGNYRDNNSNRGNGSYRENDRVNLQGKISSFSRESSGYRVHLDRGPAFWVPESYFRSRARDLRVGINISLGGIFRGGSVYVDDVSWPDSRYGYGDGSYSDGFVRGVVDRVEYRRATVWLRDDRSGRIVEVDMRGDRYGRLNLDDVRRGDFVELSGAWIRGGIFAADRIDSVRSGRY